MNERTILLTKPRARGATHTSERRIEVLRPRWDLFPLEGVILVVAQAKAGAESVAFEALRIPNYWWSVAFCEGGFNLHSVQLIPYQQVSKFRRYLESVQRAGLIDRYESTPTTDCHMSYPDLSYFDPKSQTWSFDWKNWIERTARGGKNESIEDPESYECVADHTDLLIIKELQKDGRRRFAQLGKVIGRTLQAAKLRYDRRIVGRGVKESYELTLLPFPHEISDNRDIRVDFRDKDCLDRFYSNARGLPFIRSLSKVLRKDSLIIRTYTPRSEADNLFAFLSALARRSVIENYSSVTISLESMRSQTISYELFDNQRGWLYDEAKHLTALRQLSQKAYPAARRT